MKLRAFFLSFYILGLINIPCIDDHLSQYDSPNIEVSSFDQNVSDFDLCSPFCFCQCCQTYSKPEIHSDSSEKLDGKRLADRTLLENQTVFPISLWHPPKV
jgi:hypothetical protein